MSDARRNAEAGIVLIAVLWGIVILASIALCLAASVRVAVDELQNRKEQLQAYYLARGGVFRTAALLTSASAAPHQLAFVPGRRKVEWAEDLGRVTVEISDESGKIDLNRAPEKALERLFLALGLDLPSARALVDAVEDWRDPDSFTRLNGAEESYYLALPEPYRPANADFQSVEELLLVRGVTPELFYGRYVVGEDGKVERQLGLVDCITVDSGGPPVNINYAPYPVLLAVPGMEPRVANYIVTAREKNPFASVSDLSHEFPVILGGETLSFLSGGSSGRVTLVASGSTPGGAKARIRALVQVQGVKAAPFRVLRWEDFYVR